MSKKSLPKTIEEAMERIESSPSFYESLTPEQKIIASNAPEEAENIGFNYHTVVIEVKMKSNSLEEAKKEVEDWLDKMHHRHFPKNMLGMEVVDDE
jgi:disulfide oxidoreductase YuzD